MIECTTPDHLYDAYIFDLDGTLLPATSAEWLFMRRAARARLLGPGAAVAGGWALVSAALAGGAGSKWFSHRFLLGLFLLLSLAAAILIVLPRPAGEAALLVPELADRRESPRCPPFPCRA